MEEEYVPQSQQPVEQAAPQAVPNENEMFLKLMNEELNRDPKVTTQEREDRLDLLKFQLNDYVNEQCHTSLF